MSERNSLPSPSAAAAHPPPQLPAADGISPRHFLFVPALRQCLFHFQITPDKIYPGAARDIDFGASKLGADALFRKVDFSCRDVAEYRADDLHNAAQRVAARHIH